MLQRLFDVIFSLCAILILLPFLLPIAFLLALTGEREVFYLQRRIGRGGRPFNVFKFATMLKNSPAMAGGCLTQRDDPRVLPLGHFLRSTKINELPQLMNILLGSMSFVGPRPQAQVHYDLYSAEVKAAIDRVSPGLTGIGSIVFRDEENVIFRSGRNSCEFHDRVIAPYKGELELWFIKRRSIFLYFQIIALTFITVLCPKAKVAFAWFRDLPPVPQEIAPFL
jgi:lipopolysaccharide/colanic/teichoic acid biosynthesis glycosyltransferase